MAMRYSHYPRCTSPSDRLHRRSDGDGYSDGDSNGNADDDGDDDDNNNNTDNDDDDDDDTDADYDDEKRDEQRGDISKLIQDLSRILDLFLVV